MSETIEKFKLTLKELMELKNIGIGELAKELHTSRFVIHRWLTSAKDMRINSLLKIADYFQCSVEFLCGRTDEYLGFEPKEIPPFSDWLKNVLAECDKSAYQLFRDTKIMPTQMHQWKYHTQPMLNNLVIIADYLGVTLDYLIGRDRSR